jgi:hypothetical protein
LTSEMRAQLTSRMHDDDLRVFLMTKETWLPWTFDFIDWNASELALRQLSKNRQMNVIKLCDSHKRHLPQRLAVGIKHKSRSRKSSAQIGRAMVHGVDKIK